jgi:peptidyl-tRNA hydrolase
MSIKAYFVIRQDLLMSRAKLGVQIGHGTDKIHMHREYCINYDAWIADNRRKIVVTVKNLDELKKLGNKMDAYGSVIWMEIEDLGYTEFDGLTQSGIVIFPLREEEVPKYISKLQTMKDPQ